MASLSAEQYITEIWLAEDYMCAPKQEEYLFFLLKYFSFSSELFEKHVLISFCVIVLWGFYILIYFRGDFL